MWRDLFFRVTRRLFAVVVGLSNQSIAADSQRQALSLAGMTALAGLVLLLVLGNWLANMLSRPLTDLRQSARAMGEGQLDARANTSAPPEIKALARILI